MERDVSLSEIWDGKFYELNDMAKLGCDDCKDCFSCCCGMADTVVLDPLDVHRMTIGLDCSPKALLENGIKLSVIDGVILPHLDMSGDKEACSFLSNEGRCSIHGFRPGICRLFPLGRYYEEGGFRYILQAGECRKEKRTKVKIRKWLNIPDIKAYEAYISRWHYFLKRLQNQVRTEGEEAQMKEISMYILQNFYMEPYMSEEDFYEQFYKRLEEALKVGW